jgi:hypothetical protein
VASALALMLMTAVVQVFSAVGSGISGARQALEQFDRLRDAQGQLRMDLGGVTALPLPPRRLEAAEGYFEFIDGFSGQPTPVQADGQTSDTTVGQRGAILMFTTRTSGQPFVRRYAGSNSGMIQSDVAEVAWFLRGRTLHRRVLLVAPSQTVQTYLSQTASNSPSTFFANNDISARLQNNGQNKVIIANSLADLTKREWRFAHPVDQFPFDASRWGLLGLPTLRECSSQSWMGNWQAGTTPPPGNAPQRGSIASADYWGESRSADIAAAANLPESYLAPNNDSTRMADDVVLNNVIGFEVKAWDYQAQQYVDLGGGGAVDFATSGRSPAAAASGARPYTLAAPTFCTWTRSYENEGTSFDGSGNHKSDPQAGQSTNGFDDNNTGIVDNMGEWITAPPYLVPLRGIQVKIRCFEPESRQVREVTIEQDFLPK